LGEVKGIWEASVKRIENVGEETGAGTEVVRTPEGQEERGEGKEVRSEWGGDSEPLRRTPQTGTKVEGGRKEVEKAGIPRYIKL